MKNVYILETVGAPYMAPATITKLMVFFFKATWAGKEEGGITHRAVIPLAFLTQAFQRLPGTK